MKFQKIIFALAIATFVFIGCKNDAKKEVVNETKQEVIASTDAKEIAISISGMTCEIGCAKFIQSKLSKKEGVLDAKVVFNDSIATIKYDGAKTNKASIISFVNGLADNMYKATEAKSSSADKKTSSVDVKKDCCVGKDTKACTGDKKACSADSNKQTNKCSTDCKMACCTEKKACNTDCKKDCCTTEKA